MKARNGASGPPLRVRTKPSRPAKGAATETFGSFLRNLARLEGERTTDTKRGGGEGGR